MIEFLKKLWFRLFPKPVENFEYVSVFGDSELGFMEPLTKLSGGVVILKDNFTLPSDTVKNALSRVGTLKKTKAKFIIVNPGSMSIATGTPANEIVDDLASIGREIEALGKVPVFLTIFPRLDLDDKNKSKALQSVNDWLKGRGKRGWKVADAHKSLIPEIHLNGGLNKSGGEIVARMIWEVLK
jgi:hypothetical protein